MSSELDPDKLSFELFKKASAAYAAKNYDLAVELYKSVLDLVPQRFECYAAIAQALIKSERFELAKEEADRGLDLLLSFEGIYQDLNSEIYKCLLKSGVASFNMAKYREALNRFKEVAEMDPRDKGVSQWLFWCEEKINKFGDDASDQKSKSSKDGISQATSIPSSNPPTLSQTTPPSAPSETTPSSAPSQTTTSPAPSEATPPSAPSQITSESSGADSQPNVMPVPKVKYDWYQTETHVILEVRIKSLKKEDVRVEFHTTALSITAKLAVGSDYSLEIDLAHPVVPDQSSFKILSTKLEVKLRKVDGERWNSLEGDGSTPLPGAAVVPASGVGVPYASGRDWSKVEKLLDQEAEEKKEGESALNEMFQKIYSDASDEVKKAMNKSFQESGGTVLSTNWSEIGKNKVDVKPPDGMEFKQWD